MIKIANTRTCFAVVAHLDELPSGFHEYQYALHSVVRDVNNRLQLKLVRDSKKGSSWGLEAKTGRYKLQIRDPKVLKHLPKFGATTVQDSDVTDISTLLFVMPTDDKLKHMKAERGKGPRNKKKSVDSVPELLPLKECIRMVNAHKEAMGEDLTFRVNNSTGALEATVVYF